MRTKMTIRAYGLKWMILFDKLEFICENKWQLFAFFLTRMVWFSSVISKVFIQAKDNCVFVQDGPSIKEWYERRWILNEKIGNEQLNSILFLASSFRTVHIDFFCVLCINVCGTDSEVISENFINCTCIKSMSICNEDT
jgi:hypothetical protein